MSGELMRSDASEIGDDLLILFARDERPTARRVRQQCADAGYIDSIGPDLAATDRPRDIAPPCGLSLGRAGFTFDLVGLAPGPAVAIPRIDLSQSLQEVVLPARIEAASLRLGPHVAAGRNSVSILREWFVLAHGLADTFGGAAICWTPGGVAIEPDRLGRHFDAWQRRGELPVGLFASFRRTLDGALQSHGLRYFTGQEFRIEPNLLRGDEDSLARLLFTHLFYAGEQDQTGQLATPEGQAIRLEPSANRRFVRVWPG